MKIRKFNESNSDIIDTKYLNFIFEEFIEQGAIVDYDTESGDMYWEIFILEPEISEHINKYFDNIESLTVFSKNLKSCIDKVKDEYPSIDLQFEFEILESRSRLLGTTSRREIHLLFRPHSIL
jgi:hypothetical protein